MDSPYSAQRAHAAGFVNVLAEPGEVVGAAIALAKRICLNAPLSVQACLAAVNGRLANGDDAGWTATTTAMKVIAGTHDTDEGVRAFFERRSPEWTGR